MVDIFNKKSGFSLAETLVSMLILSVFFVATSKVITTKPRTERVQNRHGFYECYIDNGVWMQKTKDDVNNGDPTAVENNTCHFDPPNNIAFAVMYVMKQRNRPVNGPGGVELGVWTGTEPQFNAVFDLSTNMVADFANQLNQVEEEKSANYNNNIGNQDLNGQDMLQILDPDSNIRRLIQVHGAGNNQYLGPALYICW